MNRNNSRHLILIHSILVLSLLLPIMHPTLGSGQDNPCEMLRADLAQENLRLTEYMSAVKKFDDQKDSEIVLAIYSKMAELRRRITNLEKELQECEDSKKSTAPDGLSPPQSEEGENAAKTCDELRKRLVALVKNMHYLRRRESSLLSQLTDAESKARQETAKELKAVREALKKRCSVQPNSKVSRQAPNPGKN